MRNGFNQFSVPYFNELTANQLGGASVFGGNMPLSYINFSLDQIAGWFQGNPQTGAPGDFEEVIINGRKVLKRKVNQIDQIIQGRTPPTFPQGTPTLPPLGTPEGDRIARAMGQDPEAMARAGAGSCSVFDLECWFSKLVGSEVFKDAGKRIGLVLLGGVLLIVAIVSLR